MHEFSLTKTTTLKLGQGDSFNLIATGKIFELTGASSIEFNFAQSGTFGLRFLDRGSISGEFKTINRPDLIDISWQVKGFGRPDEYSRVVFSLKSVGENRTDLEVRHSQILSQESLEAKTNAWSEILAELSDE